MPRPIRHLRVGFMILAVSAPGSIGRAQDANSADRAAQSRPSFANPGTPRQTERIRFFDVKHIKAELTVDIKNRELRGMVTHTISPLHPFLTQIELDCGQKLKVAKVTAGPKAANCKFAVKDEKLKIALDRAYDLDEPLELAITYSGSPERGLYFVLPETAYPEKTLSFWTQGEAEDTHHWLPCYDYPNERATSEMIITADKPLFVLSNGTLIETKDNGGSKTYHWKMDAEHVSYLISLAAADFAIYHDRLDKLPIDYYVAKHVDEAMARRLMGKTPRMVRFFAESTGQPYPFAKYAQVCVPDFLAGGMENITATTLTDTALKDETEVLEGDGDGLIAHELAHQWFGDLITCKDWSHLWLNEGFASYFDALFTENDRGEDAFRLAMHGALEGYLASDHGYRRPIVEARYTNSESLFDGVTYSKGACFLHALRGLLGDELWWKGIRRYVATHRFQVVDTDDFRRAMEVASGKKLDWFFNQWAYKGGHPELKVRWRFEDADNTIRMQVQQTQKLDAQTPLFRLPTTLAITADVGKTQIVPVVIEGASQEYIIPSAARPKMVQIDPEGWLIKELDFVKTKDENLFQLEHATCVLARLDAARALVPKARTDPEVAKALAGAWKRENAAEAKRQMIELLGNGEELFRAALLEAGRDSEPRARVAAIAGLVKLRHDKNAEALLRTAWSNPREVCGARREALRGIVNWKVKGCDMLLADGIKIRVAHHTLAATALELLLEKSDAESRKLAVLYSRFGQPEALRNTAMAAFSRLAKNDPALQDILVSLVGDPIKSVRIQAWHSVRELGLKKALPALEAQLGRERDSAAFMQTNSRQRLQAVVDSLKGPSPEPASSPTAAIKSWAAQLFGAIGRSSEPAGNPRTDAGLTKSIADLERQASDLESKAKKLRNRIAELKKLKKGHKETEIPPQPAATGTSGTSP
jgi:aminopeptidase N